MRVCNLKTTLVFAAILSVGVLGCSKSENVTPQDDQSKVTETAAPSESPTASTQVSGSELTKREGMVAAGEEVTYEFIKNFDKAVYEKVTDMAGLVKMDQINIQGNVVAGIFAHAPAKVEYKGLTIPAASALVFSPGIYPTQFNTTDGVIFSIKVTPQSGEPKVLFTKELQPKTNPADQKYIIERIPLEEYANQVVDIQLTTDNAPGKNVAGDWGLWLEPMIVTKK